MTFSYRLPTTTALFSTLIGFFFLIGAHFTFPNFGGYGLTLPQNYIAWLFIGLLIGVGLWHWARSRALRYSPQMLWFWVGTVVLALPLADPRIVDYALGLPKVIALAGGVLLYTALLQINQTGHWQKLLQWVLLATVIQMFLGLTQYFIFEPMNLLGYDTISNRPNGTFQQVNVMASFVATGFALSLFLLTQQASTPPSKAIRLMSLFSTFAAPLLLIVIQSRTGQLAGIAVILLILPALIQAWPASKAAITAHCLVFVLGLSTGLLGLLGSINHGEQTRGLEIYEDPGARTIIYDESLSLIQQYPLLGVGYGNFESAWRQTYADQAASPSELNQGLHALTHPHNETLLWGVEGGAVALFGLILLATGYLLTLKALTWRKGLSYLALTAPILIHTQTEYPLYHSGLHWMTLIVLIAAADGALNNIKTLKTPRIILPAVLALAVPLTTVPFMITGLHSLAVITRLEASKPKDYALLLEVSNPAADLNRFQWHLWELRLKSALAKQDPEELTAYLNWSRQLARSMPRATLYANQFIAQRALGDFEGAEATLEQARYLFGDMPALKPFIGLRKDVAIEVN